MRDTARVVLESIGGGAAAGVLAAAIEMGVRAAWPGGFGAGDVPPAALPALAAGAALGGLLGSGWGVVFAAAPRLAGGRATLRAALATLATGVPAVAVLALRGGPRPLASPSALAMAAAAVALGLLVAWIARRPLERMLAPVLASRVGAGTLGLAAGGTLAVALPGLLLGEPLGVLGPFWQRALLAGVGLAAAGAASAGLALGAWPRAGGARHWSVAAAALVVAALAVAAATGARGGPPAGPNVLVLVIDTLRADRLSAYGYPRETSPQITRLAARGTRFDDAVSTAPFTMPATASLLTGRLPYEHRVRAHPERLPPDELTLAEILRARGYVTGAVVSNPLLVRRWGFDQGFDFYDNHAESRFGPAAPLAVFRLLDGLGRGARAEATAAAALGWLRRHRDQPFFLWVHFFDPHFPYIPPAPYDRLFAGEPGEYAEMLRAHRRGELTLADIAVGGALTRRVLEEGADQYDGEIAYTDREVGRLLDALDALGLADETLVVLTSDHGEALGEHGVAFEHALNTYEEMMRVPLVLAGPGVAPGRRVDAQVSLLDVARTVLELAGIEPPPGVGGRSLAPLLGGRPEGWATRPAYGENVALLPGHPTYSGVKRYPEIYVPGVEGKWRMVRAAPWKLIRVPGRPGGEDLLFHLERDPQEREDLAGAHPQELARLRAQLETFLAGDTGEGAASPGELSEDEIEQLRALGYAR